MNRIDAAIGKVSTIFDSDAAEIAERAIMRRFKEFATIVLANSDLNNLNAFFHPINRSSWQTEFANWLIEQNREASND